MPPYPPRINIDFHSVSDLLWWCLSSKKLRIQKFRAPLQEEISGYVPWNNTANAKSVFRGEHCAIPPFRLCFLAKKNKSSCAKSLKYAGFCWWFLWLIARSGWLDPVCKGLDLVSNPRHSVLKVLTVDPLNERALLRMSTKMLCSLWCNNCFLKKFICIVAVFKICCFYFLILKLSRRHCRLYRTTT